MEATVHNMISRRWTDELSSQSISSRPAFLAIQGSNESLPEQKQRELRALYFSPNDSDPSAQDFDVANIAREELQKIVNGLDDEPKPSAWKKLGVAHKQRNGKTAEVLRAHTDGDIGDLKAFVDNLEAEWKDSHGPVYSAFKKICLTLDDHRTILKIFPSQNDYTSPLVGSVTILMKAAKHHSEISILLSKSIADISDKVARSSSIISIITTSRARRKLAEIYARMLQFYQRALEWYLQSRFGRFVRSFNENLLKEFEEAKKELEDGVNELYREAAVATTAMVAMSNGRLADLQTEICRQRMEFEARDALAGQRMQKMMHATWSEVKQLETIIKRATCDPSPTIDGSIRLMEDAPKNRDLFQASSPLDAFIFDVERPTQFGNGRFWIPQNNTMLKLQTWMSAGTLSSTLWISSPYETSTTISGARAGAMTTVAAAWQGKSPILSAFCKRPKPQQLHSGLSVERVGLISLVYCLIRQLLQFSSVLDKIDEVNKEALEALDGGASTWENALGILGALLQHIPEITFCAIDGLNQLEWGDGSAWCNQLLDILVTKQHQTKGAFNILFSITGQSVVLPKHVKVTSRFLASKRAIEVSQPGTKNVTG